MTQNNSSPLEAMLHDIRTALGGREPTSDTIEVLGAGDLPAAFAVSDLAAASIGAAGLAVADFVAARSGEEEPLVSVDRRLASHWFGMTLRPDGWTLPPAWDPIAGDYAAADGWIRLHTNAPHHRDAALAVLRSAAEKDRVADAIAHWNADDLEAAVVAEGGVAGTMRSMAAWAAHPQGQSFSREPLFHTAIKETMSAPDRQFHRERPLQGIKVLDLTRVLAGPVATRFLADFGADVLRLDPPDWDEPGVVPEIALGKRCARLDLRRPDDRDRFEDLLGQSDVLVHGYRSDALERLGFDSAVRRRIRPGLVDVSLDAYGWSGPWQRRRGFDSIVQMSAGIAEAGMRAFDKDRPTPLPVQALDHAAGYLLATAAVEGLTRRLISGAGFEARTSLARVAALLTAHPLQAPKTLAPADFDDSVEETAWGPAHRMRAPLQVAGSPMHWNRPAGRLGSSRAAW